MTFQQAKLLAFIASYIAENGASPSTEEMRVHLELKSKSGVSRILDGLEAAGKIRRPANRARSVEVLSGAFDPKTIHAAAQVAMDVIADHARFPGIRIEAYSVASVIARGIYQMAGLKPPAMPDAGLPPMWKKRAPVERPPGNPRQHLMWGIKTTMDGRPAVVQPLSLAFIKEDAPRRMQLDPSLSQELVRVRVTIEEIEEEQG